MPGTYVSWQSGEQPQQRDLVDKLFIGRVCRGVAPEKCIQINRPMVSRDHAVLQSTAQGIEITDLSTNGTWLNGVRMAPGSSRLVTDGDTFEVGRVRFELHAATDAVPAIEDAWDTQTTVHSAVVWVTCLVADVRGFTTMCQARDSQAAYDTIQAVFSNFSGIINAHQGTVKDFAGDAVFAFWEHPQGMASESALLACRAAIEQNRQIRQQQTRLEKRSTAGSALQLGWGITTGPATLSNYGVRHTDLALVGDSVNLAFRLSSVAAKTVDAAIVLCHQTAELVRSRFALTNLGQIPIKGRKGEELIHGLAPETIF